MQLDRRKESLEKFLMMVMRDLEMERKGREGVENLARVFQETPRFGDEEAQADVQEKLRQLKQTLGEKTLCQNYFLLEFQEELLNNIRISCLIVVAFLEATRYKLQCVLLSLGGHLRPSHPLSAHIEQHRDRQGHPQTILKIPSWIARGASATDLQERTNSQSSDLSEGKASFECSSATLEDHFECSLTDAVWSVSYLELFVSYFYLEMNFLVLREFTFY